MPGYHRARLSRVDVPRTHEVGEDLESREVGHHFHEMQWPYGDYSRGPREAAGIAFGNNMRDTTSGQPEVEYFFWGNPKDSEATGYHGVFRDPADDGSIDHLFLVQFEGHSSNEHFSIIVHEAAHHAFPGILTEDDIAAAEKCVTRDKKKEKELGVGGGGGGGGGDSHDDQEQDEQEEDDEEEEEDDEPEVDVDIGDPITEWCKDEDGNIVPCT